MTLLVARNLRRVPLCCRQYVETYFCLVVVCDVCVVVVVVVVDVVVVVVVI